MRMRMRMRMRMQAARESLAEVEAGAEPLPAEEVWAELGLGT